MPFNLRPRRQLSPIGQVIVGLGLLLTGGFILAVALGWVPSAPTEFSASTWVVGVMGATFFCGGVALLLGLAGRGSRLYQLLILVIIGGIASVTGWIAFGDGPRQFTHGIATGATLPSAPIAESTGRTAFGMAYIAVTALLVWSILKAVVRAKSTRGDDAGQSDEMP